MNPVINFLKLSNNQLQRFEEYLNDNSPSTTPSESNSIQAQTETTEAKRSKNYPSVPVAVAVFGSILLAYKNPYLTMAGFIVGTALPLSARVVSWKQASSQTEIKTETSETSKTEIKTASWEEVGKELDQTIKCINNIWSVSSVRENFAFVLAISTSLHRFSLIVFSMGLGYAFGSLGLATNKV